MAGSRKQSRDNPQPILMTLLGKYGEKGFAYSLAIYLLWRDLTLMTGLRETLEGIKTVLTVWRP